MLRLCLTNKASDRVWSLRRVGIAEHRSLGRFENLRPVSSKVVSVPIRRGYPAMEPRQREKVAQPTHYQSQHCGEERALAQNMILLITSLAKVQDCARALQELTSEPINIAATLGEAVTQLQAYEFSAVVLDQLLLDAEPGGVEPIFKHMGTAVPVYSNFAISGIERVSRELRSAIHRRKRELLIARQEAELDLRRQLNGSITALLLSCEMALGVPDLPPLAETKMRAVDALAKEMRAQLGVTA